MQVCFRLRGVSPDAPFFWNAFDDPGLTESLLKPANLMFDAAGSGFI